MTRTTLYGLKNCDTCRKVRRWLDAHDIDHRFVDYRDDPVPAATLKSWAAGSGGWATLINRRSTTWRQLSEAQRQTSSDSGWLKLAVAHPTLVKRPVLSDGKTVFIGYNEADWREYFRI